MVGPVLERVALEGLNLLAKSIVSSSLERVGEETILLPLFFVDSIDEPWSTEARKGLGVGYLI